MALAVFYTSFVLLIAFLAAKQYGFSPFHHRVISHIVVQHEEHVRTIVGKSKSIGAQIHFENFHKLTIKIATFTKKEALYLKQKFDSKQPKFLLMQQKPHVSGKHSVSFFLKNISEHKNSQKGKNL